MAIGKANVEIDINKLAINFGNIKIIEKGQLLPDYEEIHVAEYMKNAGIEIKNQYYYVDDTMFLSPSLE